MRDAPPLNEPRSAARAWAKALRTCLPLYLLDLRATHRRLWLGPLWVLLPLIVVLLLGMSGWSHRAVGRMAGLAIPYPVYVVTGLAFWQIFAEAALMPLRRVTGFRRELVRRQMTVEQAIAVGLVDLLLLAGLRLMLVLAIVAAFGFGPSATLWTLPVPIAGIALAGLIIGVAAALPGLLVEDIGRALAFLLTVGLLASPVFYPVHEIGVAAFNPLAPMIDNARAAVSGGKVQAAALLPVIALQALLLAALLLFVRRSSGRFLSALA